MHYYHDYFFKLWEPVTPLLQGLLWSAEGAVYRSVRIAGKAFYRSIISLTLSLIFGSVHRKNNLILVSYLVIQISWQGHWWYILFWGNYSLVSQTSSFALQFWQTHVQENNLYGPQNSTNYTHSHTLHKHKQAHTSLVHATCCTCRRSHTKTTESLMASVREPWRRHGWVRLLFTSGAWVTVIHPIPRLSPWQQILTLILQWWD